jgi:glycosyltransferase involved in cell wall biosynthesis
LTTLLPLTLGLLPPLQGGLRTLAEAGQHSRFIAQYLGTYAQAFATTLYFSYFQEQLATYTDNPLLLDRVKVLGGGGSRLYTFQLPFHRAKNVRRCHVLRVFQMTGSIPAAIARRRWGIPFAATYGYRYAEFAHTEGFPHRAIMLWLLEQIGLRTASAVIVTTPSLAEHVRRTVVPERIYLIPNSIDTEQFAPADKLPKSRTIIFVGRLEPQKNLFMLLDAVAQIRPRSRLVLIGDGSQREALIERAGERGVWLDWQGVTAHEKLPAKLREADIFVLPSLIEGHPKALLEAMSCGLPCVGLDVPGTRDVLRHEENGLLAPATAEGLSHNLQRLLDETDLAQQFGQNARAWVTSRYGASQVMGEEVKLLAQLAGFATG